MDFDDTPTTVTVTDVRIMAGVAYFKGIDQTGADFVATLDCGRYAGAKSWFAQTVESRVKEHGSFDLTSTYDHNRDEWFAWAGNYGIFSKDISFHSVD